MLIDIRKRHFGFTNTFYGVVPDNYVRPAIDVLLSQKDETGHPPSLLNRYLSPDTPIELKMQLERFMSSQSSSGLPSEELAFASVLDRHLSASELQDIIDSSSNDVNDSNDG